MGVLDQLKIETFSEGQSTTIASFLDRTGGTVRADIVPLALPQDMTPSFDRPCSVSGTDGVPTQGNIRINNKALATIEGRSQAESMDLVREM